MDRRIFGIETEFGVTCAFEGQRKLSPDEVARYLFRKVVSWGRSSNVFLRNGARLYLDVGSHPEYATAECDSLDQLVAHDKAGERILEDLLVDAERRLIDEGIGGDIYLFKNNTDSAGNSYGCHENYLVARAGEFSRIADVLLPFLDNPIRAIREISHDLTGRRTVRLAGGREASALDIQREYHARAVDHVAARGSALPDRTITRVLELWGRTLDAVESANLSLIDREIDWAIKHRLVERYRLRHGLDLASARVAQLDLAYHDIRRGRGLFDLLQRKGMVERVTDDGEIEAAKDTPPQTTRAKLRGDFIAAAQAAGRDFTVDWVHLKLNDQAQRTVLCKDPFRAVDERVERLIASL